ncbi:inorganic phosphate transporter [Nostocoides jenkinsii]|uniref:Low-affinity inorganic phosphate transporter n=1 Tax=Nostocoides jenkinsii Ben 74 TaxID=1193518 RepID=A0A077MFZ5_9MICO|nr:low-affinity inorganic phosphate transporter [Tetrasphaera jenkinsii Ben 74]
MHQFGVAQFSLDQFGVDQLGILAVVALALAFTFTNGFHDSANAIATSVSTRALTPRIALTMAAIANFVGAFFGAHLAQSVGAGIIDAPTGGRGLAICAAALIGATTWNLLTWWRGLPSSSSHALIGGLGGAALAAGSTVHWQGVWDRVVLPMLALPIIGFAGGYAVMLALLWTFRNAHPASVTRGFRLAQTVSASAMAFGHGMQDAAKPAGVIALALTVAGHHDVADATPPWWVLAVCALVLSAGTYAGGWRIMRTLGRRLIDLDPPRGFAAEVTAAVLLYAATALRAPVSTTHSIASAITGVGATTRARAIRWVLVRDIVGAWVLTFPAAGIIAAAVSLVLT